MGNGGSQCRTSGEINGGAGEFQSPNFGGEYGKKADCAWRFSFRNWTKYALKLDVKELKLYLSQNGDKVCVNGSYNLSINGAPMACDKFVSEARGSTFCQSYYNDETCESLSDVTGCEVNQKTEFPIDVIYRADGRNITNDPASSMWGFRIGYQFIQCPNTTTKVHSTRSDGQQTSKGFVLTTSHPTPPFPTTGIGKASATKPDSIPTVRIETTEAGGPQTSRGFTPIAETSAENNGMKAIEYRDNPVAIAGAFMGGVGLMILVMAIAFIVKRCLSNRNQRAKGQVEAAPAKTDDNQAYQTYTQFNNPHTAKNFSLAKNSVYEAPKAAERQKITLEESPGYDNPNSSNAQRVAPAYESVNFNEPHLYERPK